ncbi:MAG: hypothetical protein AB1633_04360 [Elusimicrobiota bacterium]
MIENEDYVTVEGIRFQSTPGNTVCYPLWVRDDADHITVRRCMFLGEGNRTISYGVHTDAEVDYLVVENCIFYHVDNDGIYNKNRTRTQAGWRVVNNTFYHCGVGVRVVEGAMGSPGDDLVMANNLFISPLSGYALHAGNSDAGFTINIENCGFYGIRGGLVKYPGTGNTYNYADTLMERNPDFVLTDSLQWNNTDFLRPRTLEVTAGGIDTVYTPDIDFFKTQRGSQITIGGVEGK